MVWYNNVAVVKWLEDNALQMRRRNPTGGSNPLRDSSQFPRKNFMCYPKMDLIEKLATAKRVLAEARELAESITTMNTMSPDILADQAVLMDVVDSLLISEDLVDSMFVEMKLSGMIH